MVANRYTRVVRARAEEKCLTRQGRMPTRISLRCQATQIFHRKLRGTIVATEES